MSKVTTINIDGTQNVSTLDTQINNNLDAISAAVNDNDDKTIANSERVNNIIAQSGTSDTEVVDARYSEQYGKTFDVLTDRIKALEQKAIRKNWLINSNFEIWQRGDLFENLLSNYTADHYLAQRVVDTDSQIIKDAPILDGFENSLRIEATADKVNSGAYTDVRQYIEDYEKLANEQVTFAIFLKADVGVEYQVVINDGTTVKIESHTGTGNAVLHVITGTVGSNPIRLMCFVRFLRDSISIGQGINIQWAKLEEGDYFSGYEQPSTADNLRECQRYYEKQVYEQTEFLGASIVCYNNSNYAVSGLTCAPKRNPYDATVVITDLQYRIGSVRHILPITFAGIAKSGDRLKVGGTANEALTTGQCYPLESTGTTVIEIDNEF